MKKYVFLKITPRLTFLLSIILVSGALKANILPRPALIDTIQFYDNGRWCLSLSVLSTEIFPVKPLDSIALCSGSDTIRIDSAVFVYTTISETPSRVNIKIFSDSLSQDFPLYPQSDSLYVTCFYKLAESPKVITPESDWIVWGDYDGSCVRGVKENEYIISYSDWPGCKYAICRDTICSVTLLGKVYNQDGTIIPNFKFFLFHPNIIETNSSGLFSGFAYSGTATTFDDIYEANYNQGYKSYKIESFTVNGNPGDTIYQDIHLKEMYVSEKETEPSAPAMFFSYPNPAGREIHFSYRIPEALADCKLEIFNIDGVYVGQIAVAQQEGDLLYNLGERYPAGSYSYVVSNNKSVIYRGRFFVK